MANLLNKIKNKILDKEINLIEQSSELRDYLNDIILDFYNQNFTNYISEILKIRQKYSPFSVIQDFAWSVNLGWFNQIQNLMKSINMGWVERLQEMNKTLVEPFHQISTFARTFNSILPNIKSNIEENNEKEDENDEDCNFEYNMSPLCKN